jgi:hypothetical protein
LQSHNTTHNAPPTQQQSLLPKLVMIDGKLQVQAPEAFNLIQANREQALAHYNEVREVAIADPNSQGNVSFHDFDDFL